MTADWPDYNPSAHRALAIYAQTVPLGRKATSLGLLLSQVLAPGASVFIANNLPIQQVAFEFGISAGIGSGTPTLPFLAVSFGWLDVNSFPVWQDDLVCSFASGGQITFAEGPANGDILVGQIANTDTTASAFFTATLSQTSHPFSTFKARQKGYSAVPPQGFTQPGGDISDGVVCHTSAAITPGGNNQKLLGVASGKWRIVLDNSAGANQASFNITDPSGRFSLPAGSTLYPLTKVAAGAVFTDEFIAPNRPLLVTINNLGGAGNISPEFTALLQQQA